MPGLKDDERTRRDRARLARQGIDLDAAVQRCLNGDHEAVYNELVEAERRRAAVERTAARLAREVWDRTVVVGGVRYVRGR